MRTILDTTLLPQLAEITVPGRLLDEMQSSSPYIPGRLQISKVGIDFFAANAGENGTVDFEADGSEHTNAANTAAEWLAQWVSANRLAQDSRQWPDAGSGFLFRVQGREPDVLMTLSVHRVGSKSTTLIPASTAPLSAGTGAGSSG